MQGTLPPVSAIATPAAPARVRHLLLLQVLAAFFLAIKVIYVFRVGPIFDEAYYWLWGQHPGLSYFDHPPFHAWLLGISDAIFGRNLFGLRWMTLACLAGTFYIYHLWAKRLAGADWQSLWWPGIVIYLASPTFGYFMSLAFHDYLLIFLLLASAHFFLNYLLAADAGEVPRKRDLYLGAIILGCAGLTKYNAVFLGLGVFLFILWRPSLRRLLRDPHLYVAAAIAIGMQAPVLYWNALDNFPSFNFHLNARHKSGGWLTEFNWNSFRDFPLASAFLISPFLVPVFWRFFMRRHETRFESVGKGLAIFTFWLSTACFIFVSLFDWVFWWWNLAAYVIVLGFAARYMGRGWLFYGHVVFGALVQLYLIISVTIFPLSFLQGWRDPRQVSTYGWEELRDLLTTTRDQYKPEFIASNGPDLSSVAAFALDDPNVVALTDRKTQFYYWFKREDLRGKNGLVVTFKDWPDGWIESQFKKMTLVGTTEVTRFGTYIQGYDVYYAEDYEPETVEGVQGL
jgi:4-amino-4-deoxy-L-arabinose transferase-like glycosyltransferase